MRGRVSPVVAAVAVAVLALATAWPAGPEAAVPLTVAAAAVAGASVGWPESRRWLPVAALVAAGSSLVASFVTSPETYRVNALAGVLGLVEVAAMLVLLAMVVRVVPVRTAVVVGLVLTAAALAWLLRAPPPPTMAAGLVTILVWFAGPVIAGIAGGYPRLAEERRRRSVEDAQKLQRLELARDLHDFVAHDVTGIVVQAQAAQHVGRADPAVALAALERIEAAGMHALASMDQALGILRGGEPQVDRRGGASALDLATLLEEFAAAGGPTVETRLDRTTWARLPPDRAALGFRVLTEALTNVRRHAPRATSVRVTLEAADSAAVLSVVNQLQSPEVGVRPVGGRGLAQLAALVDGAGGTLTAGKVGRMWELRAALPLPEAEPVRSSARR